MNKRDINNKQLQQPSSMPFPQSSGTSYSSHGPDQAATGCSFLLPIGDTDHQRRPIKPNPANLQAFDDTCHPSTTTDPESDIPPPPLEDWVDDIDEDDDTETALLPISPSKPNPDLQTFSLLHNYPVVQKKAITSHLEHFVRSNPCLIGDFPRPLRPPLQVRPVPSLEEAESVTFDVCAASDKLFDPTPEGFNAALEKRFLPSKKQKTAAGASSSLRIGDSTDQRLVTDVSTSKPYPTANSKRPFLTSSSSSSASSSSTYYDSKVSIWSLPPGVSKHRLRNLFEKYGQIQTVKVWERRGVVVFTNSASARRAVQTVAMRIDGVLLDVCLWSERQLGPVRVDPVVFTPSVAPYTVLVENLSPITTTECLERFFAAFGDLRRQPLLYRNRDGTRFAYVTFKELISRQSALDKAPGRYLHERRVVVDRCYSGQGRVV